MKTNKLLPLFVITVIVVAVAIFTTHSKMPATEKQKPLLFPEFKTVINKVSKITVKRGNETLTVINEGDKWKIREADGYPALFSKVKQTAVAISDMKVISKKTENPALYSKLGVGDPASENAESSLLTLSDAAGKPLVSLIVGKDRMSSAASDSHGLYVRLPDRKQALLVESNLQASVRVADWIDRDLVNISPDRISSINIVHADGLDVTLNRAGGEKDLVLENVPEGKRARSDYTLKRMESILENVQVDNVTAAANLKFPGTAVTATVSTTDGLSAVITSATAQDKHYATFTFQYKAPEKTSDAGDNTGGDDAKAKDDSKKATDVAKQVAELSAKTAGWAYQIPDYKFDTFTRTLNDLVEDIPEEESGKEKNRE